ncbi:hypothetical protein Sjap_000666 [Stephania japonica]|uniref:Uncharacterized protein n=1 Tax=Stephania japonica TaxID=461633 RepID=A0AAP0KII5_9MAGN
MSREEPKIGRREEENGEEEREKAMARSWSQPCMIEESSRVAMTKLMGGRDGVLGEDGDGLHQFDAEAERRWRCIIQSG